VRVAIRHADTQQERQDAESALAEIRDRNGTAQLFAANFEPAGAGAQRAAAITAALGHIDILVPNASIELLEDYEATPTESFAGQIAVNPRAPLELVQALLLGIKQRGWGRVLAIGSVPQLKPHPQMLTYAGTKAAVGRYTFYNNAALAAFQQLPSVASRLPLCYNSNSHDRKTARQPRAETLPRCRGGNLRRPA